MQANPHSRCTHGRRHAATPQHITPPPDPYGALGGLVGALALMRRYVLEDARRRELATLAVDPQHIVDCDDFEGCVL